MSWTGPPRGCAVCVPAMPALAGLSQDRHVFFRCVGVNIGSDASRVLDEGTNRRTSLAPWKHPTDETPIGADKARSLRSSVFICGPFHFLCRIPASEIG